MIIIYISHWRYPSAKVSSRIAIRTCEVFADRGHISELWVPWRSNSQFKGVDPYDYHHVKRNFKIRRLPAIDLMEIFPGKLSFFLMVASFNVSVALYALFRGIAKKAIFYCLDVRDIVLLNLFGPILYFEAHDYYKTPIYWLNRWLYRSAKGVTATTIMKMHSIQQEFGLPPKRTLHKPCPVDTAMFRIDTSRDEARKVLRVPSEEIIILYTGQVIFWKGVDTLLASHAFLKPKEKIYFIVGGDDGVIKEFKSKHREANAENVKVIEGQVHKDIPLWLRAADVLALPNTGRDYNSKYNTSPVKLFEYMASGRPIVASDLPSIRNIVDESTAWLFEPDNPQSLAEAVHKALSNPKVSQEKCAQAQKEAKKYDWEIRFNDIFKFIEATLS
mgnify:CR=1 FL=1